MKKKMFILLTVFYFIPTITDIIKIIVINVSQDSISILNIASQIEWFDLINETIMAFLFVPVYFVLNKFFKENKAECYFKFGIISFSVYFILFIITYFKISSLTEFMNFSSIEAIAYLKLESIAFLLSVISTYFIYVLIIENSSGILFVFCLLKLFLTCSLYIISINILGVNGIAWSNIVSNVLLSIFAVIMGFKHRLFKIEKFNKNDIVWIKSWFKKGAFSGVQILIDNIFYAIIIVRLVNMVNEQGNYWIVNNFIWGFILILSIALGELVKDDVYNHKSLKFCWPYKILGIICLFLLFTIPFWEPYFTYILNISNINALMDILYKLLPFYIFQMISTILDGKLSGSGKTHYNMISSILINACYYGGIYLYITSQNVEMTMNGIIYMFGGSMIVHTVFSLIFVIYEIKKKNLCISV